MYSGRDSPAKGSRADNLSETYFREGFIGPIRVLDEEMALALRKTVERVLQTRGPAPDLDSSETSGRLLGKRIGGPQRSNVECRHLDSPAILAACRAPRLRKVVEQLYGSDIVLWRTTLIVKEAGAVEYAWHQDFGGVFGRNEPYGLEPPFHFSVWLALTPATPENGCLRFISTLNRVLPAVPADGSSNATLLVDPSVVSETHANDARLAPGECVVFTDRAVHASYPNRTGIPRIGIAMRLTYAAVRVRPLFEGHRVIPAFV